MGRRMTQVSPDFPLDVSEAPRARYLALDSFRGIAAIAVALHHLQVASHVYFWPLTRNAYLFVELFFVLSGFVISSSYAHRVNNRVEATRFLIKRVGRVWPLHVVMLGCFVAAELGLFLLSHYVALPLPRPPFSENRTPLGIPINFFMLNGILPYPGAGWNAPSWSVSVELVGYVMFAAACLLPSPRLRLAAQVGFVLIGCAALCTAETVLPANRCVFSFFLGCTVWKMRDLDMRGPATVMELAIVVVALLVLMPTAQRIQFVLAPFIFAALIIIFSAERGAVSKLLKNRHLIWLGKISYSVYMVHFFIAFCLTNVIKLSGKLLHHTWVLQGSDLALISDNAFLMDVITVMYVAICIAVSAKTYRHIEYPANALFARLADQIGSRKAAYTTA